MTNQYNHINIHMGGHLASLFGASKDARIVKAGDLVHEAQGTSKISRSFHSLPSSTLSLVMKYADFSGVFSDNFI